ncbi:MAG TPA: DUF4255 domain-containing protein [Allosphingosinicella sp.]
MSAHFAIPATTFVLRAIIEARLKAAYGTFTPPPVSINPPARPTSASGPAPPEPPGLVLFLHHAGPNPAWRNMHDPHVDSAGIPQSRPPLVLDLHYMLAAQGPDLEREALLGIGMSALHRNGIVPRKIIAGILGPILVPATPTKLIDTLTKEPLDKQPESISISQQPVDIDLSTKLWSSLQSPLRPSAFYLATTVFLDTGEPEEEGAAVTAVQLFARPAVEPAPTAAGEPDAVITEPLP